MSDISSEATDVYSSELIRFTGALLAHHLALQCKQFKPSCFGKPLPLLSGAEAQHLSQDLRQDLSFKLSDHKASLSSDSLAHRFLISGLMRSYIGLSKL